MNETCTQVAVDPNTNNLREGADGQVQLAAGLPPGIGTDVFTLVPPGSATGLKLAALQQQHHHQQQGPLDSLFRSTGGTRSTLPYGTLPLGGGGYGGGVQGAGAVGYGHGGYGVASLSGVAALQAQLVQHAQGASTGQLVGSGWGVLSLAAQNLKAAHLLEQVERTVQHLQGLAALAATSKMQHPQRPETEAELAVTAFGPDMFGTPFAGMAGAARRPSGVPPSPPNTQVPPLPDQAVAAAREVPGSPAAAGGGASFAVASATASVGAGTGAGLVRPSPSASLSSQMPLPSMPRPSFVDSAGRVLGVHGAMGGGVLGVPQHAPAMASPRVTRGGRGLESVVSEVYTEQFESESVTSESDSRGASYETGSVVEEATGLSYSNQGAGVGRGGRPSGPPHGYLQQPWQSAAVTEDVRISHSSVIPEEDIGYSSGMHPSHSRHITRTQSHHTQSDSYSQQYTADFESVAGTTMGGGDTRGVTSMSHSASAGVAAPVSYHPASSQRMGSSGGVYVTGVGAGAAATSFGGVRGVVHQTYSTAVYGEGGDGGAPAPGDIRATARRVSFAGGVLAGRPEAGSGGAGTRQQGAEVPAHNTMDILSGPAPTGVPGSPPSDNAATPVRAGAAHGQGGDPRQGQGQGWHAGTTLTGTYASPYMGQGEGVATGHSPIEPPQQPASLGGGAAARRVYQGTGNAAQDTLLRYAALLSSEALPGGLMDPAALGRLRAELLAGAAAAAGSSGVGYADLVQESAEDSSLK